MLTPIPHTPLAERLRAEGRLLASEFFGNNVTDEVQFVPRNMTADEMREGYDAMLTRLFAPGATHRRSAARRAYLRLLGTGARLDRERHREAGRAVRDVDRRLEAHARGAHVLFERDVPTLLTLVDLAHEAMIRSEPEHSLHDAALWAAALKERITAGSLTADDLWSLYRRAREFSVLQRELHRFPGASLEKAFNLAIEGLHYEVVRRGIAGAATGGVDARRSPGPAPRPWRGSLGASRGPTTRTPA